MYNGVGLVTPRGSGSSGYVSTNKFNLRRNPHQQGGDFDALKADGPKQKKANLEILEHNRKREIEAKIFALTDSLEEQGYSQEEIDKEVGEMRAQMEEEARQQADTKLSTETHEVAARKEKQMDKLASAFGVKHSDQKEGDAFDRELQEKLKQDRIAEREKREKDKLKGEKQRKKDAKKAEKQRKKDEKKAKEDREKADKDRMKRLEAERKEEMERRAREEEAARRAALPPSPFSDRYSPDPTEEAEGLVVPRSPSPRDRSPLLQGRWSTRPASKVVLMSPRPGDRENGRGVSPESGERAPYQEGVRGGRRSPSPPPRRGMRDRSPDLKQRPARDPPSPPPARRQRRVSPSPPPRRPARRDSPSPPPRRKAPRGRSPSRSRSGSGSSSSRSRSRSRRPSSSSSSSGSSSRSRSRS